MIRVLLVDDEPIVRIAMREMIPWEQFGCEIAGEAPNGREALKRIREGGIDLALVDMQMPHMNGIELIKELHESGWMQKLAVIVLSAYSDYEYVREAFLYGACDYMIKNDLAETKVGPVISKAVNLLEERLSASERNAQEDRTKQQRLKEGWLLGAISGEPERGSETGERGGARNPLPVRDPGEEELFRAWWSQSGSRRPQSIGCLLLDRSYEARRGGTGQQARFVMHTVRQVIEGYGQEVLIAPVSPREYAFLLLPSERIEGQAYRSLLTEMMYKALSHLEQYVGASGAVGITEPCTHWKHWRARYKDALLLAQLRFFRGGGQVFFPESMPAKDGQEARGTAWNISGLIRNIEQGSREWEGELQAGMERMRRSEWLPQELSLQPYRALLWELGSLLRAQGLDWAAAGERDGLDPADRLEQLDFLQEVENYAAELAGRVAAAVHPALRVADTTPRLVSKVKDWIDGHYSEPISLSSASEMAGISESYLSKVFAKEMGETFIEYVARRRIEHAMVMMQSGMKLYEIGERVGYPNPGHFTKVFKRITGQTPLEYREKLK